MSIYNSPSLFDTDEISRKMIRFSDFITLNKWNFEENEEIHYELYPTKLGSIFVASTRNKICLLLFEDDLDHGKKRLKNDYPKNVLIQKKSEIHQSVLPYFDKETINYPKLDLFIKGTIFQFEIWKQLLQIPTGYLSSYQEIATKIGNPKASRAVGTAIGKNPIAYIIPCHRVVQTSGKLGGYYWGLKKKRFLLDYELANLS